MGVINGSVVSATAAATLRHGATVAARAMHIMSFEVCSFSFYLVLEMASIKFKITQLLKDS